MALIVAKTSPVPHRAAGVFHRVKSESSRARRGGRRGRVSPGQLEEHRHALTVHCHRMLGSSLEADDAVQETMLRAWRSLDRFEGRSSLRTWLRRIATNVCFDALTDRARRPHLAESGSTSFEGSLLEQPVAGWPEPDGGARGLPSNGDPAELATRREAIRRAFLAALQHLPPKQRAVLLLTEVIGWSVSEIAKGLDTSVAAVNSALQRARSTLARKDLGADTRVLSRGQSWLLERYIEAFERYDVDALTELLRGDAALASRPQALPFRKGIHVE